MPAARSALQPASVGDEMDARAESSGDERLICRARFILTGLKLARQFEFPICIFRSAQRAVCLSKEMMGDVVVRVHCRSMGQGAKREFGFTLLQQNLAHQNIRTSCS